MKDNPFVEDPKEDSALDFDIDLLDLHFADDDDDNDSVLCELEDFSESNDRAELALVVKQQQYKNANDYSAVDTASTDDEDDDDDDDAGRTTSSCAE